MLHGKINATIFSQLLVTVQDTRKSKNLQNGLVFVDTAPLSGSFSKDMCTYCI